MNDSIDHSPSPPPAATLGLRQLAVFVATAHGGSTRAAAGRVSRSQSAASTALSDLETALGAQLFDRIGRRLVLNENGRAAMPRAVALLDQAAELQALFTRPDAVPLKLAASLTAGEYLLPPLIARWKATHDASRVQLAITNTSGVVEALTRGDADVGFIEGQRAHRDLVLRRWVSDELVIVAAPSHPLAGRRAGAKQLADAAWVLREHGSGTREAADRWLLQHLPRLQVELEVTSTEAIKRLVAEGLGLGCLSRLTVADALVQGWLVEIDARLKPARRELAIAAHRARRPAAQVQGFIEHCLACAPGAGGRRERPSRV